jgi:hypothetical protein
MNQMSGRRARPDLRRKRRSRTSFFLPQKRLCRRLFRLHSQSALNEKEPEQGISVKRLVAAILTILPGNAK